MFSNGVLVGCLLFFLFTGSLLFFTTPFITHLIVPPYPECLGNVALERHLREIVADETVGVLSFSKTGWNG
uniref:SSD domain-containing protein n=1 Tax=Steinernema glaseri TaxID=37863 RepID=A0A1I7YGW7_9BILA